jgi:hypothetical protein
MRMRQGGLNQRHVAHRSRGGFSQTVLIDPLTLRPESQIFPQSHNARLNEPCPTRRPQTKRRNEERRSSNSRSACRIKASRELM